MYSLLMTILKVGSFPFPSWGSFRTMLNRPSQCQDGSKWTFVRSCVHEKIIFPGIIVATIDMGNRLYGYQRAHILLDMSLLECTELSGKNN